ncbi:GNAT family N-acetyltransferase [Paenibacillus sp. GXUN7292]|uniref:GNAT family N-acetyltransferase n=1 Tax=Paenibacillus sp. GXUN7292 TaxID=3422499 RepID=UPI003D7C7248
MNVFHVVQVQLEQIEKAAYLFNEYRVFYGQPSDLQGAVLFLKERTMNEQSVIYLAEDTASQHAAGFLQLYPSFSSISMKRTWILNDLYVTEPYRKQGVAQMLLDTAKELAVSSNVKGLGLSTAVDNIQAQRLYEKNGYKRDNEFFHYFLSL